MLCVVSVISFSKLLEQKEQLEQKHLHLLQILDTERQSKWQYVQQTEELAAEVRKLKNEVFTFVVLKTLKRNYWKKPNVCNRVFMKKKFFEKRL